MTHDGYDAYEVCSMDGTQLLATANDLDSLRLAARMQIEDGHTEVQYGCTGGRTIGTATRGAHGNVVLVEGGLYR